MKLSHYLKRKTLRFYARMVREKASPEYVARGWAIGMFAGCAIPFGLQLIISIPAAFVLKGSKIGATVGTMLTNHFTIFIIYPVQCWVGNRILGGSLSYEAITRALTDVIEKQQFSALSALGGEIMAAFFVGGFLLALALTPPTYFGVRKLVVRRRAKRACLKKSP